MPVCIAGMHRSGTSMVAHLLQTCGLYFGPDEDLLPASAANTLGYLEHRQFVATNELILNELGAGWDFIPPLPRQWWDQHRFQRIRASAKLLFDAFSARPVWGWKDPRNSVTLPFWQSLSADLKVVICVRNPLEVVGSLRRRNDISFALALNLWHTYYKCVLDAAPPDQRIVTHYDAYLRGDAEAELGRVLDFLGLPAHGEGIEAARGAASVELRHLRFNITHLRDAELSSAILQLYFELCSAAGGVDASDGWLDQPPSLQRSDGPRLNEGNMSEPVPEPVGRLSIASLDREALRQTVADLEGQLAVRSSAMNELETRTALLQRELDVNQAKLTEARAGLTAGDSERSALRLSIEALERQIEALHRRLQMRSQSETQQGASRT